MPDSTSPSTLKLLETLRFDNVYSRSPDIFFSRHQSEPLENQFFIHFNSKVAAQLELSSDEFLGSAKVDHKVVDFFSGKTPWSGTDPLAMCYSGHQFGEYVPRLGDGRALLLGRVRTSSNGLWDLQLKGSGRKLNA